MRGERLNLSILILSINFGFGIRSAVQQLDWSSYSLHDFLLLLLHSLLLQAVAAVALFVLINIKVLSENVEKIAGIYTKQPNSFKLALLGLTFLYIVKHNGVIRVLVVSLVSAKAYGQLFYNSKVIKVVNKLIDKTGMSTIKKSNKPTESNSLLQRHDYLPSGAKTPVSVSRITNVRGITPRTDLVSKRLFNDNDYADTKKTRNGVTFYNNSLRTGGNPARKPRSTPYRKQSSQEHSSRDTLSREADTGARSPIVEQEEPGISKSTNDDRGYNAYTELVQPLLATSGKAFNYAKEYSTSIFSSFSSQIPAPSQKVAAQIDESMEMDQVEASPQKGSARKRPSTDLVSPSKRSNDKLKSKQFVGNEKAIESSKGVDKSVSFTDAEMPLKSARTETASHGGRSSTVSSITSVDSNETVELRRNNSTSSTASTISFSGLTSDGLNVGIAYKRRKAASSLGYSSASDHSSIVRDDFVMRRKFAESLVATDMIMNESNNVSSVDQTVPLAMYRAPSTTVSQNPAPEVGIKNKKEELIDDSSNAASKSGGLSGGLSIFTQSADFVAAPVIPSVDITMPATDASTNGKIDRVESALFPLLDDVASTTKPASVSTSTAPAPNVAGIFPENSPNKSASLPPRVSPSKKPPPSPVVAGGEVPGIAFNSSLKSSAGLVSTQAVEGVPFAASSIFGGASSGVSTSQLPPLSLPPTQAPVQRVNLFGNNGSASSTTGTATTDVTAGSGISGILSTAASAAATNTTTGLPYAGGFTLGAASNSINSIATPAAVASTTTASGVSGVPSTGGFSFGGASINTATPVAVTTNSIGFNLGGTPAPITSSAVTNTTTGMLPVTNTALGFSGAPVSANPTGPTGGAIGGASTANPSAVGSTSMFAANPSAVGSTPMFAANPSAVASTSMFAGASSTANGSTSMFAGASSTAFGSASTVASSVTAPASNLFGSAPSVPSIPSAPSVPSYGATVPATTAAPFTFGTTMQGSSVASSTSAVPALGFSQVSNASGTSQGALMFSSATSVPYGSTSTVASSVTAPAGNLFGSAPSAMPTSAAPFTFGATTQGSSFMGSQNQPPNAGMMSAPAGGMFSLGTVDKRTNLKAKKK